MSSRVAIHEAICSVLDGASPNAIATELVEYSPIGIGAGIGAAGGALAGYRRARSRGTSGWRGAIKGAAGGAALGALAGAAGGGRKKLLGAAKRLLRAGRMNPEAVVVAPGAVAAIYDTVKSRGLRRDIDYVMEAIRTKKSVVSKKFVAKIDRRITVVTNSGEIYKALKREKRLVAEVSDMLLRWTAQALGEELAAKRNAFAMRGEDVEIVGVPAKTNANVIAHEVGHILDFRDKKMTMWDMKEYKTTFSAIFMKSRYKTQTLDAENVAWDKAPVKDTDEKAKIRKHAVGTYDKGFHRRRMGATAVATIYALIAVAALKNY